MSDPSTNPEMEAAPEPQLDNTPTVENFHQLLQAVSALGQSSYRLDENQRTIGRALEAITEKISALRFPTTPSASAAGMYGSTDTIVPRSVAKFREPRLFKGNAIEVEAFVDEILSAVELSRSSLPTDMDKALYLSTYLDNGSPRSWFTAIRRTNEDLLNDFDQLIDDFRHHFGDPDTEGTALRKIESLRQTGSCARYASKFRELLVYVNFNTSTTIQKYYEGLKDEVKDLLLTVHKPPTEFDEYVTLTVTIDNRLHRREVERKTAKKPMSRQQNTSDMSTQPKPPTFTTTLPPGVPMEIDATKTVPRQPLTKEERDRRFAQGLCLYCGGTEHTVKNCPNMSERAKKKFNARNDSGKA
jgi:hypothetical protein